MPAVSHDFLQALADLPLLPALVCGAFLWFVSELLLSEDRIGAKRAGSRRTSQAIRGFFNTLAGRKGSRDGAWVQRWIERFYLLVVALLLMAAVMLAPAVGRLGRDVGELISGDGDTAGAGAAPIAGVERRVAPGSRPTVVPSPTMEPSPAASDQAPRSAPVDSAPATGKAADPERGRSGVPAVGSTEREKAGSKSSGAPGVRPARISAIAGHRLSSV